MKEYLILEFDTLFNFKTLDIKFKKDAPAYFEEREYDRIREYYCYDQYKDFASYITNYMHNVPDFLTFLKFDKVIKYAKIKYNIISAAALPEPKISDLFNTVRLTADIYHQVLSFFKIKKYKINSNGSVDVFENVNLAHIKNIDFLPIKFNVIHGNFTVYNTDFSTLENWCPNEVRGTFDCSMNPQLKSLKGGPRIVQNNFICTFNNLTDLNYSPQYTGGYYNVMKNNLSSIEGLPSNTKRYFLDDTYEYVEKQFLNKKYPLLQPC